MNKAKGHIKRNSKEKGATNRMMEAANGEGRTFNRLKIHNQTAWTRGKG